MLEPKKRETLTAKKILDLYKEGRRDFTGIVCTNDSFDNFDLRGVIFRKADLSYSSFYGTNLEGADFSEANLEWTGFIRANLKRANFEKARATWARFNESVFSKTNMKGANVSWSLFFNTNLYSGADLTGAITNMIATDPSQITEEGMKELAKKLGKMKDLDPELLARLQIIASSTLEKSGKKSEAADKTKPAYGRGSGSSAYSNKGGAQGDYHSGGGASEEYHGTGAKGTEYGPAQKKKKSDPYDK